MATPAVAPSRPTSGRAVPGGAEHSEPEPDTDRQVGLGELLLLTATAAVMVVGAVSLALAQQGWHDLPAVLAVSAGVLGLAAAAVVRVARPAIRVDGRELVALAVAGGLAAGIFLPGFPYAAGDKDPGVYVIHGMAIAREGSTHFTDEIAARDDGRIPVQYFSPGARFPGLWISPHDPTEVLPQFYHLYPATLATAHDAAGPAGVFHLNPLLACLTVGLVLLGTRRGYGWPTALVAVALLTTTMLQVWQAKYPSTEIITQLFVTGALFALIVTVRTGWRPAAALAGALVGAAWLARPDGFLVVFLALGIMAALVVLRRADDRVVWGLGGLAATMPLVLYQAYDLNRGYTADNDVPTLGQFVGLVAVLAVLTAVGRALSPDIGRFLSARLPWLVEHWQPLVGALVTAVLATVLVLAWNRETLLGIDTFMRNTEEIRSYDEDNLIRLGWFLTVPGLFLLVGGAAVTGLERWRAPRWILVGPGLALLPVYLWAARNSPQLMWWGRRFIPMVLVALVVLMAGAIGWLLRSRGGRGIPLQVLGAGLVVFLVASYLSQSWPLRAHREFAGSYDFVQAVGSSAGDEQGVFLWEFPGGSIFDPSRTFGGPLWFIDDQLSALLPKEGPADPWIDLYLTEFGAEHPVFVVTRGLELPEGFDPARLELVQSIHTEMPVWEENKLERPDETYADKGEPKFYDVQVWRVTGPSTAEAPPTPIESTVAN